MRSWAYVREVPPTPTQILVNLRPPTAAIARRLLLLLLLLLMLLLMLLLLLRSKGLRHGCPPRLHPLDLGPLLDVLGTAEGSVTENATHRVAVLLAASPVSHLGSGTGPGSVACEGLGEARNEGLDEERKKSRLRQVGGREKKSRG